MTRNNNNKDYRKTAYHRHQWTNNELRAICGMYICDAHDLSRDWMIRKVQDWFKSGYGDSTSVPSRGGIARKLQECADLQRNDWMRWRRPVRNPDGSIVLVVIWNQIKNKIAQDYAWVERL